MRSPSGQPPRIVVKRAARPPAPVAPPMHRTFRGRPLRPWMMLGLVAATVVLCAFDLYLFAALTV